MREYQHRDDGACTTSRKEQTTLDRFCRRIDPQVVQCVVPSVGRHYEDGV